MQDLGTWLPRGDCEECGYPIVLTNIPSIRVFGGTDTELGEMPYMALLGYRNPVNRQIVYHCGGSVINKWYILTAAHCVVATGPDTLV